MNGLGIETDVLVVGGGPAGLAVANGLRQLALEVVVVDSGGSETYRAGEHLDPTGVEELQRLGLVDLVERRHLRCNGIRSAWGNSSFVTNDYLVRPYSKGYNLSRPLFDRAFAKAVAKTGAIVLTNTTANGAVWDGSAWSVSCRDARSKLVVHCHYVVDATGRSATVARWQGSKAKREDLLVGVTRFAAATACDSTFIYVESCPTGWWYCAHLPEARIAITYMTDADLLRDGGRTPLDTWVDRFSGTNLKDELALNASHFGPLYIRLACTQILDQLLGDGWLAVGDAAMAFDPLSSQGLTKRWAGVQVPRRRSRVS